MLLQGIIENREISKGHLDRLSIKLEFAVHCMNPYGNYKMPPNYEFIYIFISFPNKITFCSASKYIGSQSPKVQYLIKYILNLKPLIIELQSKMNHLID